VNGERRPDEMTHARISPTLLCANQLCLEEDIRILNTLDIAWYHMDVMDGHFVPNLAFGMETVTAVCRMAEKPVCVHIMAENPSDYIRPLKEAGVSVFIFHLEAEKTPFRLIQAVKAAGMKCGAAINPITPVQSLKPLLGYLDIALIMSVEPGFSGQSFLPQSTEKIKELRALADRYHPGFLIEVDGGINDENICACVENGADVLVGGTLNLFRPPESVADNYRRTVRIMGEASCKSIS